MFFYLSKIIWLVIQPLGLLLVLLFLTLLTAISRRPRLAVLFAGTATILLVAVAWSNIGQLMLQPLEDRFERPDPPPEAVAGIIVLGGGMLGSVTAARGGYELESAGDRFVEAAVLARRYPEAQIVISGGQGALVGNGEGDADSAPRLLAALGVDAERVVIENRSRNTAENAAFTKPLVKQAPGETWLLVTSAFHMPRSMALFEKAGLSVAPWPVDYRTTGPVSFGYAGRDPVSALGDATLGMREWIGLTAYWLTGRIDRIFPSPEAECRRVMAGCLISAFPGYGLLTIELL